MNQYFKNINDNVITLQHIFNTMKCCGNCFHYNHSTNECGQVLFLDKQKKLGITWKAKFVCDHWCSDGLEIDDRRLW